MTNDFFKKIFNFILGFLILIGFYFTSLFIIKITHISFPPAILGLILFAGALIKGIIKEDWIKPACDFLINNMAMFLVPFIGGLIVYKTILIKNWLVILLVIFITTSLTILLTGLIVEWGLKFLRLHKIKKLKIGSIQMINPFGFIITVLYFKLGQKLKKISILKKLPPVIIAGILLILTLEIFDINFETYKESAKYITFLLLPATIALGYPIYKHIELLKRNKRIIYSAFLIAIFIAVAGTYFITFFCHTNLDIAKSMLPKSVTAPIAVEISRHIGAIPELTACIVVLTGVFGALFGHKILKIFHVKNDIAIGLSIGAASHVIGTSRCVELKKEKQVVMASVAFVIVGVLTSLIIPLFLLIRFN